MTRLKLSAILLGATALTLPLGTTAFAQQNQQQPTQQGQQQPAQQAQQGQQGQQQAATQQNQEMGACEKLLQVLREANEEDLLEQFQNAQQMADQGDNEACALVIRDVEQAGGISEQAVAEGRGVKVLSDTETFRATEQVSETVQVQIDRQAVVEGEVLVRQPIPEIEIEEGTAEVQVRERPSHIEIEEQPAEIMIRQAPTNVRVAVPRPTIMIEQPAPEIVITMPAPGVSVERDQPQVDVVVAEPTVRVMQEEPQVDVQVEARFVDEAEAAQLQGQDRPRVQTRAQRITSAGEVATDQQAEVAVRKVKPTIRFMTSEVQDEVRFSRAEPRIRYEQAEPNVEVTFNEEPRVEIRQTGEPRVRIRRQGEDQAAAPAQGQEQQAQQATSQQQGQQATSQEQQAQQATSQQQEQQTATQQQGQQPQAEQQASLQQGQQAETQQGQADQQFQANIVAGEEGILVVERSLQGAREALDQQDFERARAEVDRAGQELDAAMQTADEGTRQQLQGLREQLDLVIVALDEQDAEGAQTALLDAETNLQQNRDVWLGAGQQQAMTTQQGQPVQQDQQVQRLSIEETNRLLAAEEGVEVGQAQPTRIRAGDLRGANVHTVRGEELGEIEEIVTSNNRLYAIVEHGGFLGIGGDQVAIPIERLAIRGDEVILLGLTEEQLEQMPNYDFERDQEFTATQEIEIGRFE